MSASPSAASASGSASPLQTLLHTPLTFVDAQLRAAADALTDAPDAKSRHASLASSNWGVESAVESLLGLRASRGSAASLLPLVPSLNTIGESRDITHLRPNQLVRFRGMVQETFQPDYYHGLWTAENGQPRTGKYRDALEAGVRHTPAQSADARQSDGIPANSGSSALDRISINVVPIPGESSWVSSAVQKSEQQSGHSVPQVPATVGAATNVGASVNKKRSLESTEASDEAGASSSMDTTETAEATASTPDAKKGRSDAAASNTASGVTGAHDHGLEVIVTLYDDFVTTRCPKVTQCFEFIGVLALNPDLAAELENADEFELGSDAWGIRRRQAIRMHALAVVPIEDGFPFVASAKADAALYETQKQEMRQALAGVRASLLEYLTAIVGGDALAGEMLLLFLLQRVHSRGVGVAGTGTVGKLALNLVAPPAPADATETHLSDKVHHALRSIMPRTNKVDMNIAGLNKQTWQPKKNYETDSLESNLLHLSSPSCLLLDETRLAPGTLNDVGIGNLQVLSRLLMTGQLEYDFQYQSIAFDVDWAVLLLSTGGRSLLQQEGSHGIDLHLKLAPTSAAALHASTDLPQPSEQQLDYWRAYLILARQASFQIAPEMSKSIENHFVSLRKSRPTVTSESTLHLLLNLARLLSLSHLESELSSTDRWQQVTDLHERIFQRNSA